MRQLNDVALEYGPDMSGWRKAMLFTPCTGICTIVAFKSQFEDLKSEVQKACAAINAAYAAAGKANVNLRYSEVVSAIYGHGHGRMSTERTAQVDVEVSW